MYAGIGSESGIAIIDVKVGIAVYVGFGIVVEEVAEEVDEEVEAVDEEAVDEEAVDEDTAAAIFAGLGVVDEEGEVDVELVVSVLVDVTGGALLYENLIDPVFT